MHSELSPTIDCSHAAVLDSIRAVLPSQRQSQRDLPRLARRICALVMADHLPDRMDAWLALNAWLSGGKLWDDVYIDSADVHGSATQRFAVLMDVLAANPPLAAALRKALRAILDETEGANLFGEVGIPSDRGFLSELGDRATAKLIPSPRDDHDLGHLMSRSYQSRRDLTLIRGLQPSTLQRAVDLLFPANEPEMTAALERAMADGFRLLLARVQGQGLSLKLRARSQPGPIARSPFKRLAQSGENLVCAWEQGRLSGGLLDAWEADVQACRDEMQTISTRLESEGISVDIVYGLDVLDRCLGRMVAIAAVMAVGREAPGPVLALLQQLATERGLQQGRGLRQEGVVERVAVRRHPVRRRHRPQRAKFIRERRLRGHFFQVADAFLQALADLFVVQPIGGRVLQALAIAQRHPAPALDKRREKRRATLGGCRLSLGPHRSAMFEQLLQNLPLLAIEPCQELRLAVLLWSRRAQQRFPPRQHLFDLHDVIGK